MTKMTFAQYARHRGVSRAAVTLAVREGRITAHVDLTKGGRYLILEEADRDWLANSDPTKVRGGEDLDQIDEFSRAADDGSGDDDDDEEDDHDEEGDPIPSLHKSRKMREHYKALQAKVEYEEKVGKLRPIDEIKREAFAVGAAVKNALQTIPDRLAPELAAEMDAEIVHKRLSEEIRSVLEEMVRSGVGQEDADGTDLR